MRVPACVFAAATVWLLPSGSAHSLYASNPQPLAATAPAPAPSSAPHRALLDRYDGQPSGRRPRPDGALAADARTG